MDRRQEKLDRKAGKREMKEQQRQIKQERKAEEREAKQERKAEKHAMKYGYGDPSIHSFVEHPDFGHEFGAPHTAHYYPPHPGML